MENSIAEKNVSPQQALEKFNEILSAHIERLLRTNEGIEGLPMNLTTVACLVLFTSRETEIESFPHLPPERYTEKSLTEELADMSIEIGVDLKTWLQCMIDKKYLRVSDGRYFAEKSAISMSNLLDKIFPQMPGLNLIAYLGQILDEVEAGRKDMDIAINQFNQMLEMQGVPLGQGKPPKSRKKKFEYLRETTREIETIRKKRHIETKPSDIFSQLQTRTISIHPKTDRIGSDSKTTETEIQSTESIDIVTDQEICQEPESTAPPLEKGSIQDQAGDNAYGLVEDHKDNSSDLSMPLEKGNQEYHQESPISPDRPGPVKEDERSVLHDDDIEKRIAAFEEALGMICPLCGTGSIQSKKTAKGKIYYHCSNEECNFISWGKPFYIECPKCSNSFLIEACDKDGKNILKCARTTCHYWQKFPWEMEGEEIEKPPEPKKKVLVRRRPRKKVLRRKVVRRKS